MTESSTAGRTRDVERTIEIDAPVAAVWKALTDARELMRWFPIHARVTPGPEGSVWLSWRDLYAAESRIDSWEPESHLRLAFPLDGPAPLATDYHLQGQGGRTVLRVVTSGFGEGEDWDEYVTAVRNGWNFELRGLRHYLERHRGADRVAAWVRIAYTCTHDAAWARFTRPGGWFGQGLTDAGEDVAFETQTMTGDQLVGTMRVWDPPRQLVATIDNWNDALLRLELVGKDPGQAVVWLSTYGVPESDVRALETRWRDGIAGLLPG